MRYGLTRDRGKSTEGFLGRRAGMGLYYIISIISATDEGYKMGPKPRDALVPWPPAFQLRQQVIDEMA